MEIKHIVYEPEYDRFIFETNLGEVKFTLEGLEGITKICRRTKSSVCPDSLPCQVSIRYYHLPENH